MELEDITQRLRSRLFDVTGDADTDPDDQFESDLNTIPTEDDGYENLNYRDDDFDWIQECRTFHQNQIDYSFQNSSNDKNERSINKNMNSDENAETILAEKLQSSIIIDNEQTIANLNDVNTENNES